MRTSLSKRRSTARSGSVRISRQLFQNMRKFTEICLFFAHRSTLFLRGRTMQILTWDDRKNPSQPRALIQQGRCDEGECNQFSISISNGERGMTVRFDSEAEFRNFLERGAAEKR